MYENIKELINNSNYDEAKKLIVEELKINDDSDLWYLLFLAENNNYLEIDPNNINNTYAYDQAIRTNNEEYELEFKLYKELALIGLNKIFRLIQLEKYDEVDELFVDRNINFKLSKTSISYLNSLYIIDDIKKISYYQKFIDYIYINSDSEEIYKIQKKLNGYISQKKLKINNSNKDNLFSDDVYKEFIIHKKTLKKYLLRENIVRIPEGIQIIGKKVFYYNMDLKRIILPNTITTIGAFAFYSCSNLKDLKLPDSIFDIGASAFSDCGGLTNITIPNDVVCIKKNTFSGCFNLTKVTLSENLKIIGPSAFYFCKNLSDINFPNGIVTIGSSAFSGCRSLKSIVLPDSLIRIESFAFNYCTNLTSITIPKNVKGIGLDAFSDCDNLTIYCYEDNYNLVKENTKSNNVKIVVLRG